MILSGGLGACGSAEAVDQEAPGDRSGELAVHAAAASAGGAPGIEAPVSGRQRVATGVRLGYTVQGDPAGTPVILLHGYSDSKFSFSPILPSLPAGYRVHALDLRGHGESDRPNSGYHMADLAADVLAYMDARRISRAVIVGHSMGTFVAQYLARAAPDRVDGLVLIAPAPTIGYLMGIDDLAAAVESFADSVPEGFIREFQASTVHRPLAPAFMEQVVAESRKLPPSVWNGVMKGMLASSPARPGSRIPALILWGENDTVFPPPARDSVATALGGARVKVFPKTGHAVHWERPAEVAAELTAFIAEVAPGS